MKRNNTILAAAVAAALGLPMLAQAQTSVQVYGRLYPQINNYDITGATARGTAGISTLSGGATGPAATTPADVKGTGMESPNARLGFRGTEDLGAGLKALFQLEMGFDVSNGQLGTANTLFSRDTFVGLGGDFGTVKLGNMDTVYKNLGDTLSFFGVSSGNFISTSNILSKPSIGGTSSRSSFHLRRANSIIYETPSIGGFQAAFDYSLGETPGDFFDNSVISGGVKYENGPIYAAIAHERHRNLFGGSNNVATALRNFTATAGSTTPLPGVRSVDTGTRLTGQYRIGNDLRVEANIARLEYDETGGAAGRFSNYKTTTWSIGAEQRIAAFTLAASYGKQTDGSCALVGGAACSTSGLNASQLNLGVAYNLSKRTALYALASKYWNGNSSRASNVVDAPRLEYGQDIRQLALGIVHNF
ncbi:Outer membrane protein (porin) [Noviherbaspirillum humi]|uniref:Outer membrane protein (Porin) n=1 Tax=Noviherbaspirillum humi TaxID=1688639 RepID=A0A239IKG4_9BURK|nr:porin [Noviherbaspirillum humi]SNS94130.1 Outer membrane protein (porin) [Noviherbaspirillum humi]